MSFDFIVVGSGFGGAVAALRLVDKGHRVAVVEQGRRITPDDMEAATSSLRKLMWLPRLGMDGFFSQTILRHLVTVAGVGVGGGSLVYGAVLLQPPAAFFRQETWARCGVDWATELSPHYPEASRMLGRTRGAELGVQDEALRRTARAMGREPSFGPVDLGIYFGVPGVAKPDPFFGGAGPARRGCIQCGRCMIVGCPHDAKNTLDRNYLHLAEARGATLLTRHRVTVIRPLDAGGYALASEDPTTGVQHPELVARSVVLAAGVLGTVEVLARSRDEGGLAHVSPRLGEDVRTNSETLVGVLSDRADAELTRGPGISTHFWADEHTHITNNRFAAGQAALRYQIVPMVDEAHPRRRALRTLLGIVRSPRSLGRLLLARNLHQRLSILTVMQDHDTCLALRYRRGRRGGHLVTEVGPRPPPSYIPQAHQAARHFADAIGGQPFSLAAEALGGRAVTAHILGGCIVGRDAATGVIDGRHRVFGHEGLFVVDASAIPGNLGLNPALTITAMAERAMAMVPPRGA